MTAGVRAKRVETNEDLEYIISTLQRNDSIVFDEMEEEYAQMGVRENLIAVAQFPLELTHQLHPYFMIYFLPGERNMALARCSHAAAVSNERACKLPPRKDSAVVAPLDLIIREAA